MSPEIGGSPGRGGDDSEVDDEGRISDARYQGIRASLRAYFERWNRHFAAEVFADIEVVAHERNDGAARQILSDIRLTRGAVALGDARLAAELAFRVGAGAQAADLMPDAKRYRSWKASNRRSSQKAHGSPIEQAEKQVARVKAFDKFRAEGFGVEEAKERAARACRCCKRTIERALKKGT